MHPKKNPLEFLTNNLAILIAVFVVLGFIQTNSFYRSNYNFDVIPYLSASEIITLSFLSLGNFTFADFMGHVSIFSFYFAVIVSVLKFSGIKKEIYKKNEEIIKLHTSILWIFVVLTFLFKIFEEMELNNISYTDYKAILSLKHTFGYIVMILLILFSIISSIRREYASDYISIPFLPLIGIYISLLFYSFSQYSYDHEASKIKYKNYYAGTIIKTADSTYLSDSCSSYIGRTVNSAFVFNFSEKAMTVIPQSEIKYLKIVTNNTDIE